MFPLDISQLTSVKARPLPFTAQSWTSRKPFALLLFSPSSARAAASTITGPTRRRSPITSSFPRISPKMGKPHCCLCLACNNLISSTLSSNQLQILEHTITPYDVSPEQLKLIGRYVFLAPKENNVYLVGFERTIDSE